MHAARKPARGETSHDGDQIRVGDTKAIQNIGHWLHHGLVFGGWDRRYVCLVRILTARIANSEYRSEPDRGRNCDRHLHCKALLVDWDDLELQRNLALCG